MKNIKKFLKENNLSEDSMDDMWKACSLFPEYGGSLITKLASQGLDWRDLNETAASTLPDLYKKVYEKMMENYGTEDN